MPRAKGERRLEILKALAQMLEAPKWERITTAALADPAANPELWEQVLQKVRTGQMPPAGRPRPDAATLASLERLRALGVRLVLDDFGKGYSSFGYLSRAHFSKIKIDQSFVRGAADGARDCVAIVHAILALAKGLGVETTAEGVETAEQAHVMRTLGCTQLQGFYFGRPVVPAQLAESEPQVRRRIA